MDVRRDHLSRSYVSMKGDLFRSVQITTVRDAKAVEAAMARLRSTMGPPFVLDSESSRPDRDSTAAYPLALTSKLSGVSPHALEVWERRYGFPVPARSASGDSYYSRGQIATIRRLVRLAEEGGSIVQLIGDYRAGYLIL